MFKLKDVQETVAFFIQELLLYVFLLYSSVWYRYLLYLLIYVFIITSLFFCMYFKINS
jgi:hypothetical protein